MNIDDHQLKRLSQPGSLDSSSSSALPVENKCSDRSIEVKLPARLGNYDKQTDQPTDRPTTERRRTDRRAHREVTLP